LRLRFRQFAARLAAVLFGLLVAELILRVAGVAYPAWDRPTPGLREWGIPHAEGWSVGEARTWVKLNAEGARDVDHETAKPEDTLRVVVVGDSYAAAFEVELEQTFWSVMERELAGCAALGDRRVEVINISKRGYGTTEELLALRRFGFAYDPDWVVLAFLTGNDFRNNSKALKQSARPYLVYEGGELVLDDSYQNSSKFRRWTGWRGDLWYGLVRHSRLVQTIRHLRRQIKVVIELSGREGTVPGAELGLDDQIYLEPSDLAWQSAWHVTEGMIRLMRDEVREQDARFLLMTLSNSIQVNPDRTLREDYAARIGAVDLFYPDRRLRALAEQEGIASLTLALDLRKWAEANDTCVHGSQEPWVCQGHWNADGHRFAGERLADKLCRELAPER
jgi:hypothetical protein